MILRPRLEGDPGEASKWWRYAVRFAHYFDRLQRFQRATRRPAAGVEITISRAGEYIIPVIKAFRLPVQYGFLCTPRQGAVSFTYGSTVSDVPYRNPDEHDGDYDRTFPFIDNYGFVPPYAADGTGTDYASLYTYWGSGRAYTRVAVYPFYGNNPAVRLFAPTSGDAKPYTTLNRVHSNFGNIDWKGPDGIALSWLGPRSRLTWQLPVWSYSIFYRGEILAVAPGRVYGACVRKTDAGYDLICGVYSVLNSRIEFWYKPLAPRAETATERATMDIINDLRYDEGYTPLWIYGGDSNIAREWAESRAEAGNTDHGDTSGRLAEIAVDGDDGLLRTKENIYAGSGTNDTPQAAVDSWVGSPGHYANIITGTDPDDLVYDGVEYSMMGVSTQLDDSNNRYYVQNWVTFGKGATDKDSWQLLGFIPPSEIAEANISRINFNASGTQSVIADGNLITVDLADTSISHTITHGTPDLYYQDADYRGDSIVTMKWHITSGSITATSTYETDWMTLNANWMYIEHVDLRHRLMIWTEFRNGAVTKMNHNGTITTLASFDTQLIADDYTGDILLTYIGDSSNRIDVAINHDGVALISGILNDNPMGGLYDAAQLYPASILTTPALNVGLLRIRNGTPYKFVSAGGGNFNLVSNTASQTPYPFSSSSLPQSAVINILSNGEDPVEILKVPDAAGGEETVLYPLGYRGSDDNLLNQPIFYDETRAA